MNGPPPVECSYTSPPSTDNLFHNNFIYEAIEQEGGRVQPCVSNADGDNEGVGEPKHAGMPV